ncbi:beta-L-arabinofuranosidase domain-containing protein [Jiangella alkaliphila]|uniref:beta-L-arabinofuranosidase domain-containing protein n=1 Tax=Jiangella alkaliphila TaxID=419479 RepID=UPI001364DCAE
MPRPAAATTHAPTSSGPLAVHLRVPFWATRGSTVTLNGAAVDAAAEPGTYLTLDRTWAPGDRVDISMPFSLRTEQRPARAAGAQPGAGLAAVLVLPAPQARRRQLPRQGLGGRAVRWPRRVRRPRRAGRVGVAGGRFTRRERQNVIVAASRAQADLRVR